MGEARGGGAKMGVCKQPAKMKKGFSLKIVHFSIGKAPWTVWAV